MLGAEAQAFRVAMYSAAGLFASHQQEEGHALLCLVVLVSAAATSKNRELLDGRWDKHDTKDSANVADLIAQSKCLYFDCPGEDLRSLRGLISLKRRLKKEEHGLKVRIRNQLLAQYFPEMDQHFGSVVSLNVVSRI